MTADPRKVKLKPCPCCGGAAKVHEGRLNLDWRNGEWEFLETEEVTSQKNAYKMDGWKPCKYVGDTK